MSDGDRDYEYRIAMLENVIEGEREIWKQRLRNQELIHDGVRKERDFFWKLAAEKMCLRPPAPIFICKCGQLAREGAMSDEQRELNEFAEALRGMLSLFNQGCSDPNCGVCANNKRIREIAIAILDAYDRRANKEGK